VALTGRYPVALTGRYPVALTGRYPRDADPVGTPVTLTWSAPP
jgi:hypothetical protein